MAWPGSTDLLGITQHLDISWPFGTSPSSRSHRSPCHRLASGYCGDYPGSLWWDFLDLPAVMLCLTALWCLVHYMTALCVFKSHLDLISKVIPVNTYCKNLPASETINSFSGSLVIVTSAKFRVKFKRRQHVWKENQTMFISKKYVRNYDGCVIPLVGGSRCEVDP